MFKTLQYCVTHRTVISKVIKLITPQFSVISRTKNSFSQAFKNMTSLNALLYPSLKSILEVFNKDENKNVNGVKELLEIYKNASEACNKSQASGESKKYPLIVLEGLDGSGKSSMSKRLAKKINAVQWRTPPESVGHLRELFDDNAVLRTAFYSMGNYIAALEVQLALKNTPVVMDRYWHSTAAYAIAQAVQDNPENYKMPPTGDSIYRWPDDLFKPDIVILLDVSEENRLQRQSRRSTSTVQENLLNSSSNFRQNVLQAYKNMYNPEIQIANGNYSFGKTLGQLERAVQILF